jgi:O-acetyl-ADP-ribose deacetylase (regulator of RNase III)
MYNIKVARGNVVNAAVEAIVTPANNNLMPGQGISKVVFYSAGKKLIEACSKLKYCETGLAIVTSGYNLTAPYLIHAVGPFWHGGYVGEAEQLASTYISIMRAVRKLNISSVAIPAICTGHGGYPLEEAVDIAISSVVSYMQSHNMNTEVLFMCSDVDTLFCYRSKINDGVPDITQYFNRKEILINAKMNDKENKLLKKTFFRRRIKPEAEQEAVQSVLKRVIKKKYSNCTILLSRKNDAISMKTVKKHQKSGPFITADSLKEYSYENGRMKIRLVPYCFVDTLDEQEAKKEYANDKNADGIPDNFENGIAPSYQERQQLTVVNVESLLWGEKKEKEEQPNFINTNYETQLPDNPLSLDKSSNKQNPITPIFIHLSTEDSKYMNYLQEITKPIEEHKNKETITELNEQVQENETISEVETEELIQDEDIVLESEIDETTLNVENTETNSNDNIDELVVSDVNDDTVSETNKATYLGVTYNDENCGIPFEEFTTIKDIPKIPKKKKKKNKSKYWPNFKPDYRSREYHKKIHMMTK